MSKQSIKSTNAIKKIDKCLPFLDDTGLNSDKKPDNECYIVLNFPIRPIKTKIKPEPRYVEYFLELFPKSVLKITNPIQILGKSKSKSKLQFPPDFQRELSPWKNAKAKYILIPIISAGRNTQVLLHDIKHDAWTLFLLPGSSLPSSSSSSSSSSLLQSQSKSKNHTIEHELIKQLSQTYQQKVDLFYVNIEFKPSKKSDDSYWWPSWVAYLSMKYKISQREVVSTTAFATVLKNTKEYQKFVNNFTKFIQNLQKNKF